MVRETTLGKDRPKIIFPVDKDSDKKLKNKNKMGDVGGLDKHSFYNISAM